MLKTRIKVVATDDWVKYIPQYKGWLFWQDYDQNKVTSWWYGRGISFPSLWSKSMAEKFIDSRIEIYNRKNAESNNIKTMKVSYEDYPDDEVKWPRS